MPTVDQPTAWTRKPCTKVVATVGPACSSAQMLARLVLAGASVFRLNFSHGDHEDKAEVIARIRQVAKDIGRPLGILADLSGPKLRMGLIPGGEVVLQPEQVICLSSEAKDNEAEPYRVNVENFHALMHEGMQVLLDDGMVKLEIERIEGANVYCKVLNHTECVLKSRKGVNLPGAYLPIPALTEKDRADLKFALEQNVDMIALSFVRNPKDLDDAREAMRGFGKMLPLIAKIEKSEAVDELEAIIDRCDGAMVARGDLGVEIPIHMVPKIQRRIIAMCNKVAKPVITATQMLNSMIENPVPTRAEVTDIYNAILDGTDAVMLSGETATGSYPLQCVEVMHAVARQAEEDLLANRDRAVAATEHSTNIPIADAVSLAAVNIARTIKADVIICPTFSGTTARRISSFRPPCRVIATSTEEPTVDFLSLSWGVHPRIMDQLWGTVMELGESDAILHASVRCAKRAGLVRPGMLAVIVAGLPLQVAGKTNFLRVMEID
ncbi:MAG: pyruvate kinase [Sumerlaeia bacterium]